VTAPPCPVCRGSAARFLLAAEGRDYFACDVCEARFMRPEQRPSPADERAHYDTHENRVDDPGYRAFLERLAGPIRAMTTPGAEGLDFGCGPGPALAAMLTESGRPTATYDPFYAPDPVPLSRTWDFVTATEVLEHLHDPAGTFDLLAGLLRPGGVLGVMTCFQTDDARFAGWWYRKDPTHVVFWRESTLRWVAAARGWRIHVPRKDVALMVAP
jgi:2-polyprenyl-3-methyl-5-hydroxy-6-metoxy-1,4-benzoquinol methylase